MLVSSILNQENQSPLLIEIGVSQFCEKARWALDFHGITSSRSTHIPLVTRIVGRRYGVWNTVPILITPEGPILGSTRVIEWSDKQK
jgi:glutathione S-transferase